MAFYLRARAENALPVFISILPQPWINASENPSTPCLMLLKTKQKAELKAMEKEAAREAGMEEFYPQSHSERNKGLTGAACCTEAAQISSFGTMLKICISTYPNNDRQQSCDTTQGQDYT